MSFFAPLQVLPLLPFLQLEQDSETVVRVLQSAPLGIVEYKFSVEEISEANTAVRHTVVTCRTTADLDKRNPVSRDYIRLDSTACYRTGSYIEDVMGSVSD